MLLAAYGSSGGGSNTLLLIGVSGIVFGFISMFVWKNKGGSPPIGFVLGFFLGLIGLIIVAIAKPSRPATTSGPSDPPPPPGN